mgnify:CR=1 FL=1
MRKRQAQAVAHNGAVLTRRENGFAGAGPSLSAGTDETAAVKRAVSGPPAAGADARAGSGAAVPAITAAVPPRDEPLVFVTRGSLIENIHRGRICAVSADDGKVLAAVGDPEAPAFLRSTAKPVQALGALLAGAAEAFGLDSRHVALMCASHRGTAAQMEALEEMLRRAGLDEGQLAMHPDSPLDEEAKIAWIREGGKKRRLYHQCAGKHLGMLAWCRLRGWPPEGYTRPGHPAQTETLARVAAWAGVPPEAVVSAVDGCGLPTFAVPLRGIALAYGRLACPEAAPEGEAEAARRAAEAMNRHPGLVEGPGRLASVLLEDPNLVAKSGAQGVFAVGLRRQRVGAAIVVSDGAESALPAAVRAVLVRFGAWTRELEERFVRLFPDVIASAAGEPAGRRMTAFEG